MVMFLESVFGKIYRKLFGDSGPEKKKFDFYTKNVLKREDCIVGDHTYGKPEILEWGEGKKLFIGKYCSIASRVNIFLGGNHRTDWLTTYPFNVINDDFPAALAITGHPSSKGDVIIGNDVWIGFGATIMSGVSIGDGAVIGAYTVVTKDVEPYTIVAGNPMRIIKKRFDDTTIQKLLALKWWDWDEKKINEHIAILCSSDTQKIDALLD
jgi:acetyltransferase-like isoleucine patch superfamily enzyme